MLPGVRRRTLTFSKQTLSAEFVLEEGAIIPNHSHVYEQTGYLLSGTVIFSIGGIKQTLSLGRCMDNSRGCGTLRRSLRKF